MFSEEEHRSLLVLHVMKNNARKRIKNKKRAITGQSFIKTKTKRINPDATNGLENSVTFSSDGPSVEFRSVRIGSNVSSHRVAGDNGHFYNAPTQDSTSIADAVQKEVQILNSVDDSSHAPGMLLPTNSFDTVDHPQSLISV